MANWAIHVGRQGYIQTDGYCGYNALGNTPGIIHLGCWVHVRRKFVEAVKAMKKGTKGKKGYAECVLAHISELYNIEKAANKRELSFKDRQKLRNREAKPVLTRIKALLDEAANRTPPRGLLGKAVNYALNQWERLERYTEDGRLRPDNNLVENAIRPFVVGRKNWLFAGSPSGAMASATIYSLIETAKANDLEPYRYLRYLFEKLPAAQSEQDYKAMLPISLDPDEINNLKF